jgi:hypothetical protein
MANKQNAKAGSLERMVRPIAALWVNMKRGLTEEQKAWWRRAERQNLDRQFQAKLANPTEEDLCEHDWRCCGLMSRQCRKCGRVEA